jgi:hypothetical protein
MRPAGKHLTGEERARLSALLAAGVNPTHAAREMGCDPRSARRLARKMLAASSPPGSHDSPSERAPGSERRLRDDLARTRRELDAALRQLNSAEDLRRSVFRLVDPRPEPIAFEAQAASPHSAPETVILFASDWQWGEVIDLERMDGVNSYNVSIARARSRRFFQTAVDLLTKHWSGPPPARIILILGGDMISGEIHDELAKTNELLAIPALKDCAAHVMGGLDLLLASLPEVPIDVISIPGNHGRVTRKPESKLYAETSYDTLLADIVELHYGASGEGRVKFYAPRSGDALFTIDGWVFVATHGDRIGSRGGQGLVGPAATVARGFKRIITEYAGRGIIVDFILTAHFHTSLRLEEGFVNGCLPGPSEYARDGRYRPRPATQWFLAVHRRRGITQQREINVGVPEEGLLYGGREVGETLRPRYRVPAIGRAA